VSNQLKISADTSEVKKSILGISKSLKDLKSSKVQIFSNEERKFVKSEMRKEITLMKAKLQENRNEISKMVTEQKKMTQGSKEELEHRKKILEAYKTQAKLAKQLGTTQNAVKAGGSVDQSGGFMGKMAGGLMAFARVLPGLAAIATIGYAVAKGMQANTQYQQGVGGRNRLKGLGVGDQSFGGAGDLARVGLSEQDMIQRRIDATSVLGRGAVSHEGEMRKAGFERAFGLEGGTMTGISSQLRGSMGGQGANEATMKLQASVFAASIEDAIGPYLESATSLLSSINENGTTQTDEITGLLAQLTKDGERTPELLAKTFASINDSVKGATGESSAFLQTAFARAGIGGGTLGGTKFAMGSGGIMGQDRKSLEKRGYNKELLDNMEKSGMFAGAGQRTGAIMEMMKKSGGLKPGQSISGLKDTDKMVGMNNLANNVFGTKGDQGFDALLMLEKVQNKQMTQKQFDAKLKEMQEGKDPSITRLDKINSTLAGQTEILNLINTNLMENLGKEAVQVANASTKVDNEGIVGVKNLAGAVNSTGVTEGAGNIGSKMGKAMNSGFIGGKVHDMIEWRNSIDKKVMNWVSGKSDDPNAEIVDQAKKMRDSGLGWKGYSDEQIEQKIRDNNRQLTAKDIGKEVANALKDSPIVNKNNTKIQMPDGKVVDRTSK
jgi:hypothetical protein